MDGKHPAAEGTEPSDGLLDVYDLALALRCSAEDAAALLVDGPLRDLAMVVGVRTSQDPWAALRCQGPMSLVLQVLRAEQIRQRRRLLCYRRRCAKCRSAHPGRAGR